MHHIALGQCHLPQDKQAIYQDIMVNNKPLQALLKQSYRAEFSQGRYRELFIPILRSKAHLFEQQSNNTESVITPIYGCQDDCCIYVYVELLRENTSIVWQRFAIDSYYFGENRSQTHQLVWLKKQADYCFQIDSYAQVFNHADIIR